MVLILFGVTGAGKTVVGRRLASALGWRFYDADEFHPSASIEKMRNGTPLSDADRWPWLDTLRATIQEWIERRENAVLACSALKPAYRDHLRVNDDVKLIYLKGDYGLIAQRLQQRRGHFMDPNLLQSQFDALEEPEPGAAMVVDVERPPSQLVEDIRARLKI